MAKFRVTTPVAGFTGAVGGVDFVKGEAVVEAPLPLEPLQEDAKLTRAVRAERAAIGQHPGYRAMAYFRAQGYGVEQIDANPEPDIEAKSEQTQVDKPPARSASKSDWKAYAVAHGVAEEDAEKLNRDELAEKFLGPKEG